MPSMLSFEVFVPEMEFRIDNPVEVVRAMAQYQARTVRNRIAAGDGSRGALPRSADGRPYRRTNQLFESIDFEMRTFRASLPYAIVGPTGTRNEAKDRQASRRRRAAARRRTVRTELRALRRAGVIGLGESAIRARANAIARTRAGRTRARRAFRELERRGAYGISDAEIAIRAKRAGKFSSRNYIRNMDIAAILANPPKDARSISGKRGVYIVFEANEEDLRAQARIVAELAHFELVEKKTKARHRGRGEVDR